MQVGYNGGVGDDRTDPWTEGNASDYHAGDNVYSISNDSETKIVGSQSIYILGALVFPDPTKPVKVYWYLSFPFSKWPGQDPGGALNAYNEVAMTETMGELNGVGFFLRTDTPFDFLVEVKDGTTATLAQSQSVKVDPGGPFSNWLNPNWVYVQLPFGPSANYKNMSDKDSIDWTNIAELRFCAYVSPGIGTINVWLDGFRFIKPLVVNKSSGTTRRTYIHNASAFDNYRKAVISCDAIRQNLENPQRYYDFENLGRADIPIGYTFSLEGVELLMRELTYSLAKDEGWTITGKGYEQT
jgi:hypothetical protein